MPGEITIGKNAQIDFGQLQENLQKQNVPPIVLGFRGMHYILEADYRVVAAETFWLQGLHNAVYIIYVHN